MKTPKSQRIERLVRISRTGMRIGSVTSRKTCHGAGAVDLRRLDELAGNLGQRRVQRDRDERKRAPDDQECDEARAEENVVAYQSCWK